MVDSEKNLFIGGILLGSILSLMGNLIVGFIFKGMDHKLSKAEIIIALLAGIGSFAIFAILIIGYILSL